MSDNFNIKQQKYLVGNENPLFDSLPDAVIIVDKNGKISEINTQFSKLFGYDKCEILGQSIEGLMPEKFRSRHARYRSAYQNNPQMRSMNALEGLHALRRDGSEFPVDIMLSPVSTSSGNMIVAVIRDVTERYEAQEKLKHLAYCDQLTGLPNRLCLLEDIKSLYEQNSLAPEKPFSVAIFKLEGLKIINETLGPSVVDELLTEIAKKLDRIMAGTSKLYRMDGNRFAVIIAKDNDPLAFEEVASQILEQLNSPFIVNDNVIHVDANVGVAVSPVHGADAEELIANASLALNTCKKGCIKSLCLFDPKMRDLAQAKRALDTELRRAFTNGEFELFYQPQVCLTDGKIVGVEALIRWRHPEQGIVGPGQFIDVLSNSPIVRDVGNWILRTACTTAKTWLDRGFPPLRIGVNLFTKQINPETLPGEVEDILAQTGLPAQALELEITEDTILNSDANIIASIQAIREKGVGIALDDFGTGYGALSDLISFPLSRIKIDRSFVLKTSNKSKESAIVRSLIILAHNLDLEVIAEGVENTDQRDFLIEHECDEVQGYFYAKPLSAQEFENFVMSSNMVSEGEFV